MRKIFALALLVTTLAACSSLREVPERHIVMVDGRGMPVDPTDRPFLGIGPYDELDPEEFDAHLDGVLAGVWEYAGGKPAERPGAKLGAQIPRTNPAPDPVESERAPGSRPRVVLFIHGGLNTQRGSVERAVELCDELRKDGVYPIFVNWQSSLFSSYWDHLFVIRFGSERIPLAVLTAPFVIFADLFRAIGRAPMTIWNEAENAFESSSFFTSANQKIGLALAHDAEGKLDVEFPEKDGEPGSGVLIMARDAVMLLPHMVLGILIDIGGTSSWDVMHRRTTLTMEPEKTYRGKTVAKAQLAAVPRLFDELRKLQEELARRGIDLQVDVIAHSMGCIISNLLLDNVRLKDVAGERTPECKSERLPAFTNIVYMADADTAQKTERAVTTYLLEEGHERANFYMLSLNDRAEVAETAFWDLPPKGSLLVWIDQSFEPTPSLPDQRAGKMMNQLFLLHRIPHGLRERVHVKSFRFETKDRKKNPVEHGDFSDGKFWRPEYFTPNWKAAAER